MDISTQGVSFSTPYASDPDISQASRQGRKRARDSAKADDGLDDHFDTHDDGRPKTRRVNPQRLAIRLGPELVAEMEALIVPGAKMPTFLVRKDFQERYQVDRRHIYDYFHSRGLRVSKEDKHTNLIRGRAMKAAAAAAAAANAPAPRQPPGTSSKVTPLENKPLKVHPPALASTNAKVKQSVNAPRKRKAENGNPRRTFLAPPSGDISRESTLSPISEPSFSLQSNSFGDISWHGRDASEQSVSDAQSLVSTPRHNSPAPTVSIAKGEPFDYTTLPSAIDGPISPLLIPGHTGIPESEYFSLCVDADASRADEGSLDQGQRADLYNLIHNSLPLGTGSYDSHAKDWSLFSGRFPSISTAGSYYRPSQDLSTIPFIPDYSSILYSGEIAPELLDLGGWISEDLARDVIGSQASASSSDSVANRSVYLGRYDGYAEPGQVNAREHILHSRGQTRVRTASARGRI